MSNQTPLPVFDVAILGSGLAGKAASLHLARAGLSVVCIAPVEPARPAVGESLDWSAPELLSGLGLPMEELVTAKMATWKRHVIMKLRDGSSEDYVPSAWLGGSPFHIELRTLHVDRILLDKALIKMAADEGVTLVPDRVVGVERDGTKISSLHTADGQHFSSTWVIDASGIGSSLLAREFNLEAIQFGPPKVSLWTYFRISESIEGTTLYMDPEPSKYLDWVWEIPINPDTLSVGFVTTGATMKAQREQGFTVEEILRTSIEQV